VSFQSIEIPVFKAGGDITAEAYRAFDHWHKQEHLSECEHDDILGCIEVYARLPGGAYDRLGVEAPA